MRRITKARIGPMPRTLFDPMPNVTVTFDDGAIETLFSFYPDEISFTESEFIGLTEEEARRLKGKKDHAYLTS